jgi:hypothetical protein
MRERVQTHLRNNVIGYVALFFALTTGAYAVTHAPRNSVTSKSVKNSSLKGTDVRDGSITGADVGDDSITGVDVNESTLTGLNADLLDGADSSAYIGPRAYGRVNSTADLSRSKGVAAGVGNPTPGVFCLDLPDLNPATSPMIVGADFASDGTDFGTPSTEDSLAMQEWDSSGADCPVGRYEVLTGVWFKMSEAVGGDDLQHLNGSFAFIVP